MKLKTKTALRAYLKMLTYIHKQMEELVDDGNVVLEIEMDIEDLGFIIDILRVDLLT